ncbi:AraC family transcriptional regulator [Eubacterium sp. MSJ-13]|uniref:helix-turn-helix domain-containing protein n=1 Tax=Eubacterium sp. MSJ-13 TaxID=2841513 RepID=UPI001C0FD041|nr:AraC family transcriptional regulator [Eubacterium sp. MSJ-13]MBU5478483.1 AraC family transcriptional regulator [Eubacterium sp. MSJ-13]
MKSPYELAKNILLASDDNIKTKAAADKFTSIDLYGASTRENDRHDEGDSSFYLENESGSGDITLYRVFPGIELVYNDMHMAYCNKDQRPAPHIMEINYCKEGRSECLFKRHQYCYMSAGDLSFCSLDSNAHQSEFPTSHYHGITVTIDFSAITEEMKNVLELLAVDINRIKALSQADEFTIIRANATIEHIFSELYKVPTAIRRGYIRVKVLELLLILTELKPDEDISKHTYFPAAQIKTIKEIHTFLVENFSEHYTIDELSKQFQISPTVMKKCFRGVYGDSIYAYMKRYRLQVAEQLLRESNLKIGEIAARVGYLNPNKFTSAFCAEYGVPPTAYRKKV